MLRCVTAKMETLYGSNCDEKYTRKLSREKKLFCPNCQSNVIFKKGKVMRPHFAHQNSECIVSHSEPETNSHIRGKEILFNWLKQKYPTAKVEYEVYIPETGQIADVFIEHIEQDLEGLRWAFEFQHSPLSSSEWQKRHNLYHATGIQDFWILDAAKFMKFSAAQGITDARLRKDLERTIFQETGLVYFLDIETTELTIDFDFYTSCEKRIVRGIEVKTDYIYHRPINHSSPINKIRVRMNERFRYGVLLYDEIEEQMNPRLLYILSKLIREEQAELERAWQNCVREKKSFAANAFAEEQATIVCGFIDDNKEELKEDIQNLSDNEFFDKYEEFLQKLILNLQIFQQFKESDDVSKKLIAKLNYTYELYKLSFLVAQGSSSLEEHLLKKDKDKVELVTYAYGKYKNIFEKLAARHPRYTKEDVAKINWCLAPYENNPATMDYAIAFRCCNTKEEVNKYIKQILENIIDYNPFADIENW